ncbi:hypothetical protein SODG_006531 [Sodalis praecaptivus]
MQKKNMRPIYWKMSAAYPLRMSQHLIKAMQYYRAPIHYRLWLTIVNSTANALLSKNKQ